MNKSLFYINPAHTALCASVQQNWSTTDAYPFINNININLFIRNEHSIKHKLTHCIKRCRNAVASQRAL